MRHFRIVRVEVPPLIPAVLVNVQVKVAVRGSSPAVMDVMAL